MTQKLRGTVHGRTIELVENHRLADGQSVEVQVIPIPSPSKPGDGIRRCAGGWKDHPELDDILDQIYQLNGDALSSTKSNTEAGMNKIENIENEVRSLTATELAAFRQWFLEFDADSWDRQLERDSANGKLADLARKSLSDHKSGKSTDL